MELHKIGLKPTEKDKRYKNNCLPATLHCLINIKFLSQYLIVFKNKIDNEQLYTYKKLLNEIIGKKCKCISLESYENILLKGINILNYEPQSILNHLLTEFGSFMLNEYKNTEIQDNMFIELQNIKTCLECTKNSEYPKEEKLYLIYDLYKEYKMENTNGKKKNVYDCIQSYLKIEENEKQKVYCEQCKTEKEHEIKRIYRKLPKVLIIFVKYEKDKKDKNVKINEEIEFNDSLSVDDIKSNVNENDRNKKYYLSSLICVRQLFEKNEHFHTFCREFNHKYYCFNGETIHEMEKIDNKLKKSIIDLNDKKERFPYVLIYTSY
jgi:hypothetical protein